MQLKVHIKVYTSINRAESKSSLDEYPALCLLRPAAAPERFSGSLVGASSPAGEGGRWLAALVGWDASVRVPDALASGPQTRVHVYARAAVSSQQDCPILAGLFWEDPARDC